MEKQRIVVLGAGESGVGAAMLAQKQGFEVFVSDFGAIPSQYKERLQELNIAFEEKQHTAELILNAVEVVKSPGIPEAAPMIKALKAKGISVVSEIEFAKRYTKAKTICITGSNGKTTTSMLTYHILKNAGLNVALAGNIGNSFAALVATADFDYYVLEISSFMLDDMYDFRADISILLNITPDHLDRYDYKLSNYAASKLRITQNQQSDDVFIYCADDDETLKAMKSVKINSGMVAFSIRKEIENGAYLEGNNLHININLKEELTMSITELALQGKHNVYNSMAAGIVAKILDIKNSVIRESMSDFKNIEHRLEHVGKISGVEYINDSKATNVNSTWYALESVNPGVILIMGGVDKGNDYSMLKDLVREKVRAIVCLGRDNKRIHEAFEDDVEVIVNTFSANEAVQVAYHLANKGNTVLLSPACASFDLFKNYEDRGNQFKMAVKEL
ncbi:UDP-N-acetylmuramoyl-L-alanine--D-glutamate ligase [Pedobacter sp. PLR]|uniref:UDP-N-acetylmuramoyl-L-alanine--D-glutamate ligase n=1 Tax=Pedobacter sp. PLR TaxID=2994465 RepID=UPI002245DAF7|nr:UDP-N-acetylmuramoyl-L-alanine--D-glutamate ligase [Pedobacter sp. PLR]MCX2451240.1 UDP-N-acetylmuramoyl-L-alanine--D-glutamate ligase [Pedobacter sp. PLR]